MRTEKVVCAGKTCIVVVTNGEFAKGQLGMNLDENEGFQMGCNLVERISGLNKRNKRHRDAAV